MERLSNRPCRTWISHALRKLPVGHSAAEGNAEQRLAHNLLELRACLHQREIEFPAAAVGVEEKEILGSYSAAVDLQDRSAEIVFQNSAMLRELISHRFELESIGKAFEMAAQPADDFLKLVVLP